ncbi:MAG: dihydropteroate synthase [Thermodesulfobacteriota bacterium]|jgi:5-methyltetrahydrofolate--homocysteine methyltransferase
MLIIGERINSSRKPIAQAVASGDKAFIQREARMQEEAGADYLDVNAGVFLGEESDRLKWIIETVQEVISIPLCIDSADAQVIAAVLPLVNSPPMINSITLEARSLESTLPLVVKHKAKVIGLCQGQGQLAQSAQIKVELAGRLVEKVTAADISLDDLYIDPLIFPLANDVGSGVAFLQAISRIMKDYPGIHTVCGLTNISYGLPNRKLINRTFLIAAIASGMDSAILDPTDRDLYRLFRTAVMVMGMDDFCMDYIRAYKQGRL